MLLACSCTEKCDHFRYRFNTATSRQFGILNNTYIGLKKQEFNYFNVKYVFFLATVALQKGENKSTQ